MKRKHPCHFLYVSGDSESDRAVQICKPHRIIRIIDVSDEQNIPELPKPRMITPEGRYTTLEGIQLYVDFRLIFWKNIQIT